MLWHIFVLATTEAFLPASETTATSQARFDDYDLVQIDMVVNICTDRSKSLRRLRPSKSTSRKIQKLVDRLQIVPTSSDEYLDS